MGFEKIIEFTLREEGGAKVTHDPNDPGGTTKYGIAQRYHPGIDVANLTEEAAKAIYKRDYWDKVAKGVDDLLDMAAFDSAVNMGVGTVLKCLQGCPSWGELLIWRQVKYQNIVKSHPGEERFLEGWLGRVDRLRAFLDEPAPKVQDIGQSA